MKILAHEVTPNDEDSDNKIFVFLNQTTEFGTKNCATHHICNDLTMFVGRIRKVTNIGVKGVGGIFETIGLRMIFFLD